MADTSMTRILIVDDEENIRHLLRLAFEEEFEVVEAVDGLDAFEKAVRIKPHIILSDIMMPRLDGYGLYRKIKSRPETSAVPFVFLSAKKDVDERVVGLEMGVDDYITKPFSIKELKAKVRSITRKVTDLKELGSLEGLLKEVDLVDVIQLIDMGRKTGMLLLETPGGTGKVYFDKGGPIFAQTGAWNGVEAFNVMLSWRDGRFKLDQKALEIEGNIDPGSGQELLMEGVRLSDEMEEAIRELPPGDGPLFLSEKAAVDDEEMILLAAAFKGGSTVADALRLSGLPPYRFYPLVTAAVKKGLLSVQTETGRMTAFLRGVRAAIDKL
ncbi:MAG: response regulator [bacterium]|nr:response regulator [bacterium]MDT8396010.1 response regulator [bacterium]